MTHNSIFGEDIVAEYQANQFAHYLLKNKDGRKKKIAIPILICIVVAVLEIGLGIYAKHQNDEAIYTENFYRTETGTKYHVRDCMYIKDKTDVYRLTKEEFYSGEYEPCEACMPDEG